MSYNNSGTEGNSKMRKALAAFLLSANLLGMLIASSLTALGAGPQVDVITVKGVINPISAGYIDKGIQAAEADGASALVIQMDTPGGLDTSMRDIIQHILSSKVPVVIYVAPQGARAASAGMFITTAAHVAAMAPNTNIGAAHPVSLGGAPGGGTQQQSEDTETTKVTNDAVAYVRGLAEQRGRNADWAEQAVRQSVSVTANEAKRLGVVDLIAADLPDLLSQIDGREVSLQGATATLRTAGAPVRQTDMGPIEQFLMVISDPNIAILLLSVASIALFVEITNPGLILPGVVGGISLFLSAFALGMLPVNLAAVGLLFLAFILFILEIKIQSYGMLTIGGIVSMALGSLLLVNDSNIDVQVSRPLIALLALGTAAGFYFIVSKVRQVQQRRPTTGREGLVGEVAVARSALSPEGYVLIEGELWSAVADEGPIPEGQLVRIIAKEGFKLRVSRT